MTVTVTIETENGPSGLSLDPGGRRATRTYTGHVVCRGPSTMEMLLTEPFGLAGRIVQFPIHSVVEERLEPDLSPKKEIHRSGL